MIVRYEGELTLMDAEALSVQLRDQNGRLRAMSTIRKHCIPVSADPATGVQLYDLGAATEALKDVPGRRPTPRLTRRKRRS